MNFWLRLDAFFRIFCIVSKLSKLFSKRVNQKIKYTEEVREIRRKTDPESQQTFPDKRRPWNLSKESVNIDSHFLAVEKEGKTLGKPITTSPQRSVVDPAGESLLTEALPIGDRVRNRSRPVHEAIELFDKSNEIETSLPRYQNKASRVTDGTSPCLDPKCRTLPDKVEKLRDHFQQKFSPKPQKCKSEKDCHSKFFYPDNKYLNSPKSDESNDQKSEKEKQNSLLKVNLSQLNKNGPISDDGLQSLKNDLRRELSEHLCKDSPVRKGPTRPTSEIDFQKKNKNTGKEEKTAEYGGGWDCHRCGRRVYHAERMLACGNAYHKSCFSCVSCRKLLGPRTYLEAEMEIYCSQCHAKKFGLKGYGYGIGPAVLQTSP